MAALGNYNNCSQSNSSLHFLFRFVSIFQVLFLWVSLRSMLFSCFSTPIFQSILQTKIHLETEEKPPDDPT